jgi:hypothetical protein
MHQYLLDDLKILHGEVLVVSEDWNKEQLQLGRYEGPK